MHANRLKILLLFVLAISYSCGGKDATKNSSGEDRYELVKVDSLIVDELEELQITDYSPKTKRYLAYGTNSRDCMEIDLTGNIMNRVHLSG